jgi:hypothetical protein
MCACGNRCSPTAKRCWSCHAGKRQPGAHPLKSQPKSLRSIAREAHLAYYTVKKAAAGIPVSRSSARRISEVTGIDVRLLILGRGLLT